MIEVKYYIHILSMFVKVSCSAIFSIWNVVLRMSNDGMYIDPCAPNITMSGGTLHPLFLKF